ncbi:MAG: hypothetical protein RXR51_08405 [Nitrososphaeria archaeon]
MPIVTVEKGQDGETIEVDVCLANGCVEYYETKDRVNYSYNEHLLGREEGPEESVQIVKEIKLNKRENYKDYVEKLIENYVIHFDEGSLPEDVKEVYDVYKFALEQWKKNRSYLGVKIEGRTEKGMNIYFRIRCDEGAKKTRVIVDFKVEKGSESLMYYYDTMTANSVGVLKKQIERVMALLALFSEYVSQPIPEEGGSQGQGQSQQEPQAQERA